MNSTNWTETASLYTNLENMSIRELLTNINHEDQKVPKSVAKTIPQIEKLVEAILPDLKLGGRLFYIGAGTSGRLGVVDASECPPTFGVSHNKVIGIIAGGDQAIRKSVEHAEDDPDQAWKDLQNHGITKQDAVIGLAASGRTPYVVGGIKKAQASGLITGGITCNPGSPVALEAQYPILAETGPEFLTGSTRMKAGTAQKLILNMISTSLMIQLGYVKGNKMVDMQLSNKKLVDRGVSFLIDELGISAEEARILLEKHGSVRKVLESHS